jgi:hypothetical protein
VETVWRLYGDCVETRGDGVGADLTAKANRGRGGTYALETVRQAGQPVDNSMSTVGHTVDGRPAAIRTANLAT